MRSLWVGFSGEVPEGQILLSGIVGNRMNQNGALALPTGCVTRSGVSAERSAVARVLVRRHPHTCIVNVWMIVTVIGGAVIAVADGLTRTSIFDRKEVWTGPLEYAPYVGGDLFAG